MTYPDFDKEHPNSIEIPNGRKIEFLSIDNDKEYSGPHIHQKYIDEIDLMNRPYDWALDDRALKYDSPQQKFLCPNNHECYESLKYSMKNYVLCSKCVSQPEYEAVSGRLARGMYYAISNENVKKLNA